MPLIMNAAKIIAIGCAIGLFAKWAGKKLAGES
jgi:hypothetical protein